MGYYSQSVAEEKTKKNDWHREKNRSLKFEDAFAGFHNTCLVIDESGLEELLERKKAEVLAEVLGGVLVQKIVP